MPLLHAGDGGSEGSYRRPQQADVGQPEAGPQSQHSRSHRPAPRQTSGQIEGSSQRHRRRNDDRRDRPPTRRPGEHVVDTRRQQA